MPEASVVDLLRAAAEGTFPPADGTWAIAPAWRAGVGAVIAFTGHAVIVPLRNEPRETLQTLGIDGMGGATMPHVITHLAGPDGWIDNLDVLLIRPANAPTPASDLPDLVERADLHDHPRAAYNRRIRDEVISYGPQDLDSRSIVTISRGIGGLREIGLETDGNLRGHDLLAAGLRHAPAHEPVVAAIAPGNARALRTFLGLGFIPVGSVQLCTATGPTQPAPPSPARA